MSEGTNRNMPARNTLVQLLALYTKYVSHNVQRYRQTDRQTDRRTDGRTFINYYKPMTDDRLSPIADHTV